VVERAQRIDHRQRSERALGLGRGLGEADRQLCSVRL